MRVEVNAVPAWYPKCPRCYRYTPSDLNHDGLCDRCCKVIVDCFPDHWSVPLIKEAYDRQRAMTREDWIAHAKTREAV